MFRWCRMLNMKWKGVDEVIYTCRSCRRRRRRGHGDDGNLKECEVWIGILLLACIAVIVFAVLGVLLWIMVTQ
jgi:hypothetical protein